MVAVPAATRISRICDGSSNGVVHVDAVGILGASPSSKLSSSWISDLRDRHARDLGGRLELEAADAVLRRQTSARGERQPSGQVAHGIEPAALASACGPRRGPRSRGPDTTPLPCAISSRIDDADRDLRLRVEAQVRIDLDVGDARRRGAPALARGVLPRSTMRASLVWKRSPSAFDSRGVRLGWRRGQQESDREHGPGTHAAIVLLAPLARGPLLRPLEQVDLAALERLLEQPEPGLLPDVEHFVERRRRPSAARPRARSSSSASAASRSLTAASSTCTACGPVSRAEVLQDRVARLHVAPPRLLQPLEPRRRTRRTAHPRVPARSLRLDDGVRVEQVQDFPGRQPGGPRGPGHARGGPCGCCGGRQRRQQQDHGDDRRSGRWVDARDTHSCSTRLQLVGQQPDQLGALVVDELLTARSIAPARGASPASRASS